MSQDKSKPEVERPQKQVTPDQEAWIQQRIRTAINMAMAIDENRNIGADKRQAEDAIDGVVNGTAIEIINLLGLTTEGVNLRLQAKRDHPLENNE